MASSSTTRVQSALTKLREDSSRDEYNSWKELMLGLMESTNLVGYVDGTLPLPPDTDAQAHQDWERIDRSVKDWILDSLSDELVPTYITCKTSRDVWLKLETLFTHPTPPPTLTPLANQGGYKRMPLALYKAALRGDWVATKAILDQYHDAAEARVKHNLNAVLHIAVGTGRAIPYLRTLVKYLSDDTLALKNGIGATALDVAAHRGNLEAAKILVDRRRDLLYDSDIFGIFPVIKAALSAHRPSIEFFLSQTRDDELPTNPYANDNGVFLLNSLINSHFFDIALDLIDKYPDLAKRRQLSTGHSGLRTIALNKYAFKSGARFNFWESLIYSEFGRWPIGFRTLHTALNQLIQRLVPRAKWIHEQKVKHEHAQELVICLCQRMETLSEGDALAIFGDAMVTAAKLGIHEVIEAIVDVFPYAIYCTETYTKRFFFHIAVDNRCEKVFNLIYQMGDSKNSLTAQTDSSGDTLLHSVARLAPSHKLNLVSGAALQMQREIQWFKEVEKFIKPYDRELINNQRKTPRMLFTEEHSNLKVEGEKWMKDTANSCSIAAALIATVVFAAAITVPGGNADTGYPLFVKSSAFIIFAVSDAISLFTSSTSLLMFLSILTSRYAEEDFVHALPKRLCVGLFTLFLSILFMMAAFSATIFLVFAEKSAWVLIPVAALACLPVASFVLLQFPLLVDVISSTYGHGIFGKQSDRLFH